MLIESVRYTFGSANVRNWVCTCKNSTDVEIFTPLIGFFYHLWACSYRPTLCFCNNILQSTRR